MPEPSAFRHPVLTGLFDADVRLPHKRARQTARAVYHVRRTQDSAAAAAGRETRQGAVLRLLAAFWNRHQFSPTSYELFVFTREHGALFRDIAALRPRLTELTQIGLIEPAAPRRCRITGEICRTWRVREAGSQESR